MSHKHSSADKIKKFRQNLGYRSRIGYHFVRDSGKLGDVLRYRNAGIDKCVVLCLNLAVLHDYRADFGYFARCGGKSRCFYIEHAEFVVKRDVVSLVSRAGCVINVVSLNAVENFYLIVECVGGKHCYGKALQIAVIRNSYRLVSPAVSGFYDIIGFDCSVHCRHTGVKMKLHSLLGSVVHSRAFGYFNDIGVLHIEVVVVCVALDVSSDRVLFSL